MDKRRANGWIGWLSGAIAAAIAITGCATEEDLAKQEQALSIPGPWDIPDETIAIGDSQHVDYTGAGPWVGSSGCYGSIAPGAVALRDWLGVSFPQVTHVGGYACRSINGDGSTMSVHATGRALDIHIPLHEGAADNDLGDPVGNWLIEHAEEIGIQYIIWDRWTWGAHRSAGEKERAYGGAHPHHDHLHIELSTVAAEMGTPWFAGPMEPPDESGCDPLPADGGVIEETSACFRAYGPATYWRQEHGAGHDGSLFWTNAYQGDAPSNWGRWHIETSVAREYAVEVYVDSAFGVHAETRYLVRHAGIESEVVVDQGAGAGWVRLGLFPFEAGGAQHVSIYDDSPGPVGPEQHIAADALRLVVPAPQGGGGEGGELPPQVDPEGSPVEGPDVPDGGELEARGGLVGGCTVSPVHDGMSPMLFLLGLGVPLLGRISRRRRRS